MHARYYNPNLGRFLSVDRVGGTVGSSQSWNRYSYVRNNPLAFVDPDGRKSDLVFDEDANTLTITSYVEFYGEDVGGLYDVAIQIANDIEEGWSGTVVTEGGVEIKIEMNVEWVLTESGGQFSGLNYDQIALSTEKDYSVINEAQSGGMTNSLLGGITTGRINPKRITRGLFSAPRAPGEAVHEWGHVLGLPNGVSPFGASASTDPMDTEMQQPSNYQVTSREAIWLLNVAAAQAGGGS